MLAASDDSTWSKPVRLITWKALRRRWSLDWWQSNPDISHFRGALYVFNFIVDDITVASCHGTSTKKNDLNESADWCDDVAKSFQFEIKTAKAQDEDFNA